VSTLLNSGNVVFTVPHGKSSDAAPRIEQAIKDGLGVSTRVTVLTGREIAAAVEDNPFAAVALDPSRLLVLACPDPKALKQLSPLLKERWAPEAIAVSSRVAYLGAPAACSTASSGRRRLARSVKVRRRGIWRR
jgi:uncharacterized protein (DUF1697 family)